MRQTFIHACFLVSTAALLPGCDIRSLAGSNFLEPKVCEQSNPDCVFQTTSGVKQQICETTNGQCRACGKGAQAASSFDLVSGSKECRSSYQKQIVCDSTTFECRSCRVGNQECVNSDKTKPVCDSGSGECRACTSPVECKAEGFITCSGGQCQPCATNTDCLTVDTNFPTCDKTSGPTPVCRGCMVDADCDTLLCDTGKNPLVSEGKVGRCVPKNSIAWVDNNPSCATTGADGSDTKPFCTADAAYNSGAKYLYLKPSSTTYSLTAAISRDLILIGKGTDPSKVSIGALAFNVAGKLLSTTNLTIQDSGKVLLQCAGGTVRLYKTYLDGKVTSTGVAGFRGIEASSGCTEIEIQQSKVTNLASAGIALSGSNTKYTIVNTFVFKAAQNTDSAVMLNSNVNGVFAFNTIRGNGYSINGLAGGIDCGTSIPNRKITNSIVMQNATNGSVTQLTGNCELTKTVVGNGDMTPSANAIKKSCVFANTTDGTLSATDTFCIDQADQDPTVTTDFFGGVRPLGTAPDIGYHEAK